MLVFFGIETQNNLHSRSSWIQGPAQRKSSPQPRPAKFWIFPRMHVPHLLWRTAPGINHSLCEEIFSYLSWPYICPDEALSHCYQDLLLIPVHHAPVRSPCPLLPRCFAACTGAAWLIPLHMQRSVFALVELQESQPIIPFSFRTGL